MVKTEAVVTTLKLTPNEIPISPSFEVCMIYEYKLNLKIVSMMKSMNFMSGMGLGRNQQDPPRFIEQKIPILKYGLGYQGEDESGEGIEAEVELHKRESKKKTIKVEPKRKAL